MKDDRRPMHPTAPTLTRLLVAALAGLTPAAASGQNAPPDSNTIKNEIAAAEAAIQGFQETKDLIEVQAHVLLPGANVLVPRETAANLFVVLLREGRMQLTEVEAYAETLRRTTQTYARNIVQPQLDSLSRKLETLRTELGRQRGAPGDGAVAIFPAPLRDWQEVRGELQGNWYDDCADSEGQVYQSNGTFRIQLVGDGSVRAFFNDGRYDWPIDGTILTDGRAFGRGKDNFGTISWNILFARLGNQLAIQGSNYGFTYTPDRPGYTCRPGILEAPTAEGPP
jgi:hypothetical protein